MPKAEREGWLSISYGKWMDTCVEDDTYAFVIEAEDSNALEKVEKLFRGLYRDVSKVKQLLLVKGECIIGYIIKCRSNRYILTKRDIEIILKREIKDESFNVTGIRDYMADGDMKVMAFPTGCPWRIQSSF